jgi:hypothetical protein
MFYAIFIARKNLIEKKIENAIYAHNLDVFLGGS